MIIIVVVVVVVAAVVVVVVLLLLFLLLIVIIIVIIIIKLKISFAFAERYFNLFFKLRYRIVFMYMASKENIREYRETRYLPDLPLTTEFDSLGL